MTEEEIRESFCKERCNSYPCKKICDYCNFYIEGYEQGNKDDVKFCENVCMKGGKITELEKENEHLKKICDYNCPVHKLATHNTCLTYSAVRNSPYHDLKDVSEEELQEIRNEAEKEAEM